MIETVQVCHTFVQLTPPWRTVLELVGIALVFILTYLSLEYAPVRP